MKRSRISALILLLAVAVGGVAAQDAAEVRWKLTTDFRRAAKRENPNRDGRDDPAWHFLRTTRSEGPIETRRWLRDGRYELLTAGGDKLFGSPADGWLFRDGGNPLSPLVAMTTADYHVGLAFKPGELMVAPGPDHAVVIGWRSPAAGRLEIAGIFEHAQDCCGVNSKINWFVERGPPPDVEHGFEPKTLASGTSDFGSETQQGKFSIRDQAIEPGEFVYFIVDAWADGTATPHHGDGTRFDVLLTLRDARFPPPPSFESDVLPILAAGCHECHGEELQEGRLDLRTLSTLLRGGENGPAVLPGDPEGSLLLDVIARGQMPPGGGDKLTPAEVSLIRRWIKARTPAAEQVVPLPPHTHISEEDRSYWAFQSPRQLPPPTPQHSERVRTPIDAFLLASLEAKGLAFSPEVDRATLIRRACFDLTGLPPTPQAVATFLADARPDAYERLIDELLASPNYGERWGRHWLDAAGYVDNRLFDGDLATIYPNEGIWRYRDYVVRAFNEDKPYDRFVTEQLAGDELVDWRRAEQFTEQTRELLAATGYLRGVEDHTSEPQYGIEKRYDVLFGVMETVSTSLLGLTMECCRCHNHKYDPLPQRDYYRLMACFEPALNVHDWKRPQERFLADVSPAERAAIDRHNEQVDKQLAELQQQLKAAEEAKDEPRQAELQTQIQSLTATRRSYGKLQALWDVGQPPASRILRRGNVHAPGMLVQPGFPEVLQATGAAIPSSELAPQGESTGRRLALSQWLTRPDHPLTARVIVNRVWHHHFGRGIVATPGNFGHSGSPPTHPELLDWLAVDFVANGWSIKRLQRQIMTSSVYRQSSRRPGDAESAGERLDPENQLLWRMNLRRLEAEVVRDAVLAVSGQLDLTTGGPPVELTTPADGLSEARFAPTSGGAQRRSIYLFARRVYPLKFLELFDSPIMPVNCTQRTSSATVLQSLALLNSEFLFEQADRMASRVAAAAGEDSAAQVQFAFQLALARPPQESEQAQGLSFLADQARIHTAAGVGADQAQRSALADLCHMLLSTNEFLYVE